MQKDPWTVGLVGFGKVAEVFHAPLISSEPALRLTHVVERHEQRSRELYPDVCLIRSAQELMNTEVNLVVILTPNATHYELARLALSQGKHVVLDKPMTLDSAQADELIALAQERGLLLSVFHNRRWDGDFLTLRQLLGEGRLGELLEIESRFDRCRPRLKGGWREEAGAGSGLLYDLGSHLIDQALVLLGNPRAVLADLRRQRGGPAVDSFQVLLDYPTCRVNLFSGCFSFEPNLRFRVRGRQGSWVKKHLDPQEAALQGGILPGPGWGEEPIEHWGVLTSEADGPRSYPSVAGDYPRFYREIALALSGQAPPPVLASQARATIRAIELCLQSAQERRWVEWS